MEAIATLNVVTGRAPGLMPFKEDKRGLPNNDPLILASNPGGYRDTESYNRWVRDTREIDVVVYYEN